MPGSKQVEIIQTPFNSLTGKIPIIADVISYAYVTTFVEGEFQNCNVDIDCTVDNIIRSEIDINALDIDKPTKFSKLEIYNLEKVEIEELVNVDPKILNVKNNFLPKGLVPLDDLFDSNDVARKPKWSL